MVQVVSIEHVPRMDGSVSFQSKHVNGAQYSVCLLLFNKAFISTLFDSVSVDHSRR